MRAPPRLTAPRSGAPRRHARRRLKVRPSRQTLCWIGLGLGTILVGAGMVWLIRSPLPATAWTLATDAALGLSSRAGFALREAYVEGREETTRERVLSALGVSLGQPLASIDIESARARLAALPWIKDAAIERRLPGTLYVRLTERQPMALWQRRGEIVVIDGEGVEIAEAPIERFAALPLVVGEGAPAAAPALLAILAREPELRRRVTAAVFVGQRRWTLRLDDSIDVHLPEDDTAAAWMRLTDIDRRDKVLEREISAVDLRLPDRLVLRTVRSLPRKPPAAGRQT